MCADVCKSTVTAWRGQSDILGYPQYCWEFHDNSSESPSPESILKKEASPAVLGGREFWKRSGSLKCLELQGLGHPSRTLKGNSRKRSESVSGVFPEFFRNFFRKVPAVLGVWPRYWTARESRPRPCIANLECSLAERAQILKKKQSRLNA